MKKWLLWLVFLVPLLAMAEEKDGWVDASIYGAHRDGRGERNGVAGGVLEIRPGTMDWGGKPMQWGPYIDIWRNDGNANSGYSGEAKGVTVGIATETKSVEYVTKTHLGIGKQRDEDRMPGYRSVQNSKILTGDLSVQDHQRGDKGENFLPRQTYTASGVYGFNQDRQDGFGSSPYSVNAIGGRAKTSITSLHVGDGSLKIEPTAEVGADYQSAGHQWTSMIGPGVSFYSKDHREIANIGIASDSHGGFSNGGAINIAAVIETARMASIHDPSQNVASNFPSTNQAQPLALRPATVR